MLLNTFSRTLGAVAALSAAACAPLVQAGTSAPITVKLVAFNDYHGNLESPGSFGQNTTIPSAQRPAVGGAEYLAAYVAAMRAQNPNTVVVGGGDFIGATPLVSALFFDEPSVETLNLIGVDFSAVGNHEFDKGKAELKRLQNGGCKLAANGQPDPNSCKGFGSAAPGSFDGARFKWLSANVIDTATGNPLLPAYGVKSFGGVKVAFIGMTLADTPEIVTPEGIVGLTFLDEVERANALVPELTAMGVRAITAASPAAIASAIGDALASDAPRVTVVRRALDELLGRRPHGRQDAQQHHRSVCVS